MPTAVSSSQIIKNVIAKKKARPIAIPGGGSSVQPVATPAPTPFAGMPQQNPFPTSGFANQGAQNYFNQVFGMMGLQGPAQTPYSLPPMLQGFANTGYANIFQQLLSGFQQPQQPGPLANPQNTMMRYMGPLGNGGGYLTGKPFVPPTSGPKMRMIA